MSRDRERRLLRELDRLAFIVSGIAIVVFIVIYFTFAFDIIAGVPPVIQDFVLGITLNIIPIFLVFVVSYAFLRRIQEIKSEYETEELASTIVGQIQTEVNTKPEVEEQLKQDALLIKNADTNVIYLKDQYGLPHPISDENTILYLMEVLNYQLDNIPEIPSDKLKPEGAEITSMRKWKRPRTKEDDMSFEVQTRLKWLDKDFQSVDKAKILFFRFRYDGESDFQVASAQLIFNADAPVNLNDILAKNQPNHLGLLTCNLLFEGDLEARRLPPQTDFILQLMLREDLSPEKCKSITNLRLGYIKIEGIYKGTQVYFHKDV